MSRKPGNNHRRKGAWAIGAIAAEVTSGAFERHGLGRGEIAHAWPHLVGPQLAPHCRPERVAPARKGTKPGSRKSGGRNGGTLHIIAADTHAIDVHYMGPQIIEGVNALYGENVVSQINVRTSTKAKSAHGSTSRPAVAVAQDLDKYDEIRPSDLRHALARLEAGMLADKPARATSDPLTPPVAEKPEGAFEF